MLHDGVQCTDWMLLCCQSEAGRASHPLNAAVRPLYVRPTRRSVMMQTSIVDMQTL